LGGVTRGPSLTTSVCLGVRVWHCPCACVCVLACAYTRARTHTHTHACSCLCVPVRACTCECAQVLPSGGQQYSTLRRAAETKATGEGTQDFRMPDTPVKAGTWTVFLSRIPPPPPPLASREQPRLAGQHRQVGSYDALGFIGQGLGRFVSAVGPYDTWYTW
jgi:hypothetical protein